MASYMTNAENCDMYLYKFLSQKLKNIVLSAFIDFLNDTHVQLNKICRVIEFCSKYFELSS